MHTVFTILANLIMADTKEKEKDTKGMDIEPPMACVARVLRAALPENISLTKEARSAFSRAVAVFIFYLTHCANEICRENKRQTIAANDVFKALKWVLILALISLSDMSLFNRELGYEDFERPLLEFLECMLSIDAKFMLCLIVCVY